MLHNRLEYRFDYALSLFWEHDIGIDDEPENRFDGGFADFDGDGATELVFAPNLHKAYVFRMKPDAPPGQLFELDHELDLGPFAARDNIVTIVVDLDGDGRDDLVLVDGVGRVWTHHSDAQGMLAPGTLIDAPVLPPMAATVLARDVDRDGVVDLVGAATMFVAGEGQQPGELAIARGETGGGFTQIAAWTAAGGPTQTKAPFGPAVYHVHLVLLDLDASGYPALVYALAEPRKLVVHPQVGRTLGAESVEFPLDLAPAGNLRRSTGGWQRRLAGLAVARRQRHRGRRVGRLGAVHRSLPRRSVTGSRGAAGSGGVLGWRTRSVVASVRGRRFERRARGRPSVREDR